MGVQSAQPAAQTNPLQALLQQIMTSLTTQGQNILQPPPQGQPAAAQASAGQTPMTTFQQYLAQAYPNVSGWSQVGNRGLGTEWTAMFTPPAGNNQTPYPIYVAGPSSMSAPFSFQAGPGGQGPGGAETAER
jgi:hypothetical protein